MLTIDRSQPTFVAKAIGLMTGTLKPAADGRTGTIVTEDGTEIAAVFQDRVIQHLLSDPTLFAKKLDLLVYPRTNGMDLQVTVIKVAPSSPRNPDRDLFLIQGIALRNRRFSKTAKLGIRPNTSDRNNRSNFDKFWLNLHGILRGGMINTVYQVVAKRRGSRLFIIQSDPHIRTGKRWQLMPREEQSS